MLQGFEKLGSPRPEWRHQITIEAKSASVIGSDGLGVKGVQSKGNSLKWYLQRFMFCLTQLFGTKLPIYHHKRTGPSWDSPECGKGTWQLVLSGYSTSRQHVEPTPW